MVPRNSAISVLSCVFMCGTGVRCLFSFGIVTGDRIAARYVLVSINSTRG